MDDAKAKDMDTLRDLRRRLGGPVVDELQSTGILGNAPLASAQRRTAKKLLAWEPAIPYEPFLPPIDKVRAEQFLSDNLPSALLRLGGTNRRRKKKPDGTAACLAALVRRAYSALLASTTEGHGSWHPLRLRSLDEHSHAAEALRDEPNLDALWTADELLSTFGRSKNSGRMYDPVELLIHGAWRLCVLRGDWTPSALLQAVSEQTQRLRAAAHGEQVEVPIFFGVGDIQIPKEVADQTLRVRPYRGSLQSSFLGEAHCLQAYGKHGCGIIVERQHPWEYRLRYESEKEANAESPKSAISKWSLDDLEHWGSSFVVAIGMSRLPGRLKPHHLSQCPQDSLTPIPAVRWIFNADPLYGTTSFHLSDRWRGSDCPEVVVDAHTLAQTKKLYAIDDRATRIAIGRLSAALDKSRGRPDRLIDAVIAWEALSGDCSRGGTALQVCAVIAELASDKKHRKQVRKEVARIYRKRGRVVHGAAIVPDAVECDAANLAGLTALRRLVDDFPALIGSEDRFEQLCLDS